MKVGAFFLMNKFQLYLKPHHLYYRKIQFLQISIIYG